MSKFWRYTLTILGTVLGLWLLGYVIFVFVNI